MDDTFDYYELLGLDENATTEEIKTRIDWLQGQALARLKMDDADQRFEANRLYDQFEGVRGALADPESRIVYDAQRAIAGPHVTSDQAPPAASAAATPATSWADRARALYDQGSFTEALHAAERAVGEDPDSADAWFGLAVIREALGDDKGHDSAWERAVDLYDPKVLEYHLLQAELDREDDARALEIVVGRLAQTPDDEDLQSRYVRLLIKNDQPGDAHAYVTELHTANPTDPRLVRDLAWVCLTACEAAITQTTTGHFITSFEQLVTVSKLTRQALSLGDVVDPEMREHIANYAAAVEESAIPVPSTNGLLVPQWEETARLVAATENVIRWGI